MSVTLAGQGAAVIVTDRTMAFVRWRGALSAILGHGPDPRLDGRVADLLSRADTISVEVLVEEFKRGFDGSGEMSHELTVERQPLRCQDGRVVGPRTARHVGARARPALELGNRALCAAIRSFQWFGQLAYAKGLDRSVWHDVPVRLILMSKDQPTVLTLTHAWEAGWNSACSSAKQLRMEAESPLDVPQRIEERRVWKSRNL